MRLFLNLLTSFVSFMVILFICILYPALMIAMFLFLYAGACAIIAYIIIQSFYDEE